MQHDVLDVIVAVHQMRILRHGVDQRIQLFKLLRWQVIFQKARPIQGDRLHIRQDLGSHLLGVNELEELNTHLRQLVRRFFALYEELGIACRVQQFKNRTVAAAFDTHHIVGDRRRHACDKGQPRKLPSPMDFGQRVGVEVDFDDGIGVDTVYLAVLLKPKNYAQTGAGAVLQPVAVQLDRIARMLPA